MMHSDYNDSIDTSLIESKQLADMITVAFEFCTYIEQNNMLDKEEVLVYLGSVLPLLYLKGTLLPIPEQQYDYQAERFVTEELWENVYNAFQTLLGEDNIYTIWNKELNEAYEQSLSENIADLYQDTKDFILLYTNHSYHAKMSAVSMFAELFQTRWGHIIASMLGHIHYLIYIKERTNQTEYE